MLEKFHIKIEHLWGLIVLLGVFIFVNTHPIRPNDFWFHIAYGRLIVENRALPAIDTFSFTMYGQPYEFAHNYWLAQVFMYWLFENGGAEWSILVISILVTAAYTVIFLFGIFITRGNWRIAAFATLFAASLGISNWNIRPQTLVYLLAALSVVGIEYFKNSDRKFAWGIFLGVIMALWVNSHGTYFIPFVLAGAWLAELLWRVVREKKWQVLLPGLQLFLFLLVGVLINPRGVKVFSYLLSMTSAPSVQGFVAEWQPVQFDGITGIIFLFMLSFLLIAWVTSGKRLTLSETLSLIVFVLLSLRYERAVVWLGITQSPLMLSILQEVFARFGKVAISPDRQNVKLNFILVFCVVVLSLFSVPWLKQYWPLSPEKKNLYALDTPVDAVRFMIGKTLPNQVFAEIAFSSYLTWAAGDRYRVFVDPRFDLYPEDLWGDYLRISMAQGRWEEKLKNYNVDMLMLSIEAQPKLLRAVGGSPNWESIYQDDVAAVFVRQGWRESKTKKP
jgi:hypothetical protein